MGATHRHEVRVDEGPRWGPACRCGLLPDMDTKAPTRGTGSRGKPRTPGSITVMAMLMSLGPSADLWMYSYSWLIYWARWSFAHASTVWATV